MVEVPYKTTSQLLQDVAAGRIHYTVGTPVSAETMVKAGKARIIAVTSANRYEGLPDVATVSETLPGLAFHTFMTLVAPAATPNDVVLRLNRAIATTLKDPELRARLLSISVLPADGVAPEAIAESLRGERDRWRTFIGELGVQPE